MDRPLPYNIDAEEALLGSILLDESIIPELAFLRAEDFYRNSHQWVFQACMALHTRQVRIDFVTIVDELESMKRFADAGGHVFISKLMMRVPSAIHAKHYAALIERNSILRQMFAKSQEMAMLTYEVNNEQEVDEILTEFEAKAFSVRQERRKVHETVSVADLVDSAYKRIEDAYLGKGVSGIPTHSSDLNYFLRGGGLQKNDLLVLAARPGMGKTSLMIQMMLDQAENGHRVLCFSLEMSKTKLIERMISNLAQVNSHSVAMGKLSQSELERVGHATELLRKLPIIIHDERGMSPFEIRATALKTVRQHGSFDVMYIDHLQEVGEHRFKEKRNASTADIVAAKTRAIRNMALELNTAIVLLAQLNRGVESRPNKRPMLSDLRDSGGVEETADAVIFIYRDEVYNPKTEYPGVAELIISKQRDGATAKIEQGWDKETGRWRDLDPHTPPFDPSDYATSKWDEVNF